MNTRKNYLEFVEEWNAKPENAGKSFTYGCALYDFCRDWNGTLDDLGIEELMNEKICTESGASYDWVEGLNDNAKLEILDISTLDDYGRMIAEEEGQLDEE